MVMNYIENITKSGQWIIKQSGTLSSSVEKISNAFRVKVTEIVLKTNQHVSSLPGLPKQLSFLLLLGKKQENTLVHIFKGIITVTWFYFESCCCISLANIRDIDLCFLRCKCEVTVFWPWLIVLMLVNIFSFAIGENTVILFLLTMLDISLLRTE